MEQHFKPMFRQALLVAATTILALFLLLRSGMIDHLAYQVEKGRIRAMREAMPSAAQIAEMNSTARAVAATVAPAVVQISTRRHVQLPDGADADALRRLLERLRNHENSDSNGEPEVTVPDDEVHRNLLEPDRGVEMSAYGSGFIVDSEKGHIVTNNHVVEDAEDITVYLSDGRRCTGRVLGADPKTDLAVIQIAADRLHALALADSRTVEVGDDVMAVGNPFGLDGTFSRGIISAKGRSSIPIPGVEYQDFLQTDAVINPGNSGGPLVNMRGEVIAVNTAIATESGHYDGVGFAIPSTRVKQLLPALVAGRRIERGYLGVRIADVESEREHANSLGWTDPFGVIVQGVIENSPAENAGLLQDDIIVDWEHRPLRSTSELIESAASTSPGDTVELTIWRENERKPLAVTLGRQPKGFSTRGWAPADVPESPTNKND